jgi:hypothetical protein
MTETSTTRPSRDVGWIVSAGAVLVLAAVLAPTLSDPDLWGHTRFGLDVLHARALPQLDPYSFTQDKPELYHEWLGAVLLAAAYAFGGAAGIVVLKILLGLAIFLVFKDRLQALNLAGACVVAVLIAWNILPVTAFARPQLWTLLGLLLLVRLLDAELYLWVPLLFAAWANLHGGWVMGLGVLGAWCAATAGERWARTREVRWPVVVLPAAAFLATGATPYGWRLWTFVAETVRLDRSDIVDWQPLFAKWEILQVPIVLTVALLVAVSLKRRTRPSMPWLLVCALLIYGSIRISRVAFVSMPAILLIALPSLARWLPRGKVPSMPSHRLAPLLAVVPLSVASVATAMVVAPSFKCLPIQGVWIPDPAAIPVLEEGVDHGRIVTWFGWGEYALWHLGPRLKVSMDGRRETLYSPRILAIHYSIYDGSEAGSAWLMEQRPEYVWLKTAHRARREWLASHGYRIDWQSDQSWIAVREDLPKLTGPTTIASTGCFPGP